MNKKTVFIDRDGTINVEKNYLHTIDEFEYIDGVVDGLRLLSKNGYDIVIVTNQSGIGRGLYSEDDFIKLNSWMLDDLKKKGINVLEVFYCPHFLGSKNPKYNIDCTCRKPKIGLFETAKEKYSIDYSYSYCIGDRLRDLELCKVTDCKGYLISQTESFEIIKNIKNGVYKNIKYKDSLLGAVLDILDEEDNK